MLSKKIALYPGSFDPFHRGHLDIVRRASKIFDEVHILIANNPNKSHRMFRDDRMVVAIENMMVSSDVPENVSVRTWSNSIADAAKTYDAHYIVRGVRGAADMDYEATVARGDSLLYGNGYLEHVYLLASPKHANISSSLVRELVRCNASMEAFNELVPYEVSCILRDEFGVRFADEES